MNKLRNHVVFLFQDSYPWSVANQAPYIIWHGIHACFPVDADVIRHSLTRDSYVSQAPVCFVLATTLMFDLWCSCANGTDTDVPTDEPAVLLSRASFNKRFYISQVINLLVPVLGDERVASSAAVPAPSTQHPSGSFLLHQPDRVIHSAHKRYSDSDSVLSICNAKPWIMHVRRRAWLNFLDDRSRPVFFLKVL